MVGKDGADLFDELVAKEGDALFRFLYWSLGHREDALDAVQEVLIRAFRGLADLENPGAIRGWLFRIATNVAHDTRAKRRRAPRTFATTDDDDESPTARLPGREATPIEMVAASETNERLAAALATLPEELRAPLVLFAISGLKYREIADALGWPLGTVTTRIHAARLRLQDALGGRQPES